MTDTAISTPVARPWLKSWQPGVSGNPTGRPKGFGALVREKTHDGAMLVRIVMKMLRSDDVRTQQWAIEWLSDRGWGRPVQSTELSGPDGAAIPIQIFVPWAPAPGVELADDE